MRKPTYFFFSFWLVNTFWAAGNIHQITPMQYKYPRMNYMLNNSTVHNHIKFIHVASDKMNDKYHTWDPYWANIK